MSMAKMSKAERLSAQRDLDTHARLMDTTYEHDGWIDCACDLARRIRDTQGVPHPGESRWIVFNEHDPHPKRKTPIWDVATREDGSILGEVRWYGAWRKYAFFPGAETLYEPTCLRDIASFIERQMAERKVKRG